MWLVSACSSSTFLLFRETHCCFFTLLWLVSVCLLFRQRLHRCYMTAPAPWAWIRMRAARGAPFSSAPHAAAWRGAVRPGPERPSEARALPSTVWRGAGRAHGAAWRPSSASPPAVRGRSARGAGSGEAQCGVTCAAWRNVLEDAFLEQCSVVYMQYELVERN